MGDDARDLLCFVPRARVCYLKAVDMWSLGVIFYTLIGGYHPFHDERQTRLFRRIRDGSFLFHEELWGCVSDQAKVCVCGVCVCMRAHARAFQKFAAGCYSSIATFFVRTAVAIIVVFSGFFYS